MPPTKSKRRSRKRAANTSVFSIKLPTDYKDRALTDPTDDHLIINHDYDIRSLPKHDESMNRLSRLWYIYREYLNIMDEVGEELPDVDPGYFDIHWFSILVDAMNRSKSVQDRKKALIMISEMDEVDLKPWEWQEMEDLLISTMLSRIRNATVVVNEEIKDKVFGVLVNMEDWFAGGMEEGNNPYTDKTAGKSYVYEDLVSLIDQIQDEEY